MERLLEQYLHGHIPLSAAMQVRVRSASRETVMLDAPIEPNINHKNTVFGGSASALAILAAWSLVHLRLREDGLTGEIVIQSNRMDYERPIRGSFTAASTLPDEAFWPAFTKVLLRRGRARIEVVSLLTCEDAIVGRFSGRFVALRHGARSPA